MHRLFVALTLPDMVLDQLLLQMGDVSGVRWQRREQLHITLRFIGEVERRVAEDVALSLSSIRHKSFQLSLRGTGAFERRGRPEVLWAGVSSSEELNSLHKKVDQACVQAGLQPERRAYKPHITLARLKPSSGPIEAFLSNTGSFRSEPFSATSFALYESTLTPEGAYYKIVETYPLI